VSAVDAFIGLGSNLAHPRRRLAHALRALRCVANVRLVGWSGNYASAPVDTVAAQPDYVNAVAHVRTSLPPRALLAALQRIERRQRRRREQERERNLPRTLDLDLLLYGRRRATLRGLVIPHPRMHQRAFVLRPLTEIAPTVTIPGRGLARRYLRDVRRQRIAPTRSHALS
jgi:2-amino-4-hydroxy-6-hydroxymethyldihydropteridine diphosphokinase